MESPSVPDADPCRCILCAPPTDPAERELTESRFEWEASTVARFGWAVVSVAPNASEEPGWWSQTVGLWHTFRAPQVAIFGLAHEVGQSILNQVGDLVHEGVRLTEGQALHDVITGYPLLTRTVHPSWHPGLLGTALGYYRGAPTPFLQLVWPDLQGRWPWDPDVDDGVFELQPSLWVPLGEHPGRLWAGIASPS